MLTILLELEARDHRDKLLFEELADLKARVARVDRLEKEKESLQAEVNRLREIQYAQPVFATQRIALEELSPNKYAAQRCASGNKEIVAATARASDPVKYKAVVARCKELDTKYKGVRKLLEDHRLKLRTRNETIDAWARHCDTLQIKLDGLEARLKVHCPPTDELSTAQADAAHGVTSVTDEIADIGYLKRPSPDSTFELELPSSPAVLAISDMNSVLSSPKGILSELPPRLPVDDTYRSTSSGTTHETALPESDAVDLPPYSDQPVEARLATIKVELSSDAPVIVSSRSARKRKHGRRDSEDAKPSKHKLEHSSSSGPEIISESHHESPAESIDFDEEVHVPTPRKRRALAQSGSERADVTSKGNLKSRLLPSEYVTTKVYSTPAKSHTPLHGIADEKAHMSAALLDNAFSKLQRTGPGAIMNNPTRPNVYASNLALGIKDLAEDRDAEAVFQLQRPVVKGRLDALLNSASTNPKPPIYRGGPPTSQNLRSVPVNDSDEGAGLSTVPEEDALGGKPTFRDKSTSVTKQNTRASPFPDPGASRKRAPKKPSILREDVPRGRSITREGTPLRERSVERLRPEDFKPNPLYNDGLPFVYDEVVRGKDARAALSGCIDPNCCGKTFRQFAEAELKSVGSAVTMRADDVGLMERYLGDEAFKLGSMSREEREESWLKAKTWELANKFGKHRHRYSRMPTPPGFWSMDFPNTQERAEELRQAQEIRMALVTERYREAMRCKGSWLFRDEDPH